MLYQSSVRWKVIGKSRVLYTTCGAENIGEETLAKIFKAGYTTIPQMLNVTYGQLIHIDGFGDGIANIILDNNQRIMQGGCRYTHASQ